MDIQELASKRKNTIDHSNEETTWGGPAGDILTGIRNTENAPAERAIWELVQNARDVSWEGDYAVVSFVKTEKGLQFSHHGKPFTSMSLEALIRQTSSKVRSDIKTVGKYGTGFLVTHRFGRVITLAGKLKVVDEDELYYPFSNFEIDRSSEDKDILKKKLQDQSAEMNSWGFDPATLTGDAHGLTKFEYASITEAEKNALKKAFENAPNHVPHVLALNCKYISEISFTDEEHDTYCRYKLGAIVQNKVEEGESYILNETEVVEEISGKESKTIHIFTLCSKDIDARVDDSIVSVILPICPIEGGYNSFVFDKTIAKLYLSLPLIGTENWGINFIIHSPLFECENDSRSGLRIVPQGLGLPDNDNRKMLDCAYNMVKEWLTNSLAKIIDRKYLGITKFDLTSKNVTIAAYHEELQKEWVGLFKELPIAKNDKDKEIQPKNLYVVDRTIIESAEKDNQLKDAIYEVLVATYPEKVPSREDFLYWSKIIIEWNDEELTPNILGVEDIVIAIENLIVPEAGLDEDWINRILCISKFMIATSNEALFSHKIIPNEEGTLHEVTFLSVPDEFTNGFRSVIDDIVPSEKQKFVHQLFRSIGLSALGAYKEKEAKVAISAKMNDLQSQVANKLKAIETDIKAGNYKLDDTKWEEIIDDNVLNAILRLYTMWIDRNAENMEAKLHKLFSDYMGVTEFSDESIGKENFTDCEQMWRTLLFEIMYRFERLTNEQQKEKRAWLKNLVTVLKKYTTIEDYLKRFLLFPDQNGILHYADELIKGVGIDKDLIDYYDSIVSAEGETIKSKLVDDEFADYLPTTTIWDNGSMAGKIEDVVSKAEGYPSLQKYAKKSDVLQIVRRFNKDTDEGRRWIGYFKLLAAQKSTILVSVAESESVFKLLLQPEERLELMSKLVSNVNCDQILEKAQKALEQQMLDDADMQYKRSLGLYVETYLLEHLQSLLKDGETIHAEPNESVEGKDIQGGQDIIVYIMKGEEKLKAIYYIEVKSRWSTRESVEMTKKQLEVSAEQKDKYALCYVDMHDYDKERVFRNEYPKEFSEIKDRVYVVDNIGERNAILLPYINENSTDVHLGGDIKSVVPQGYVKRVYKSFDALMDIIAQKMREYYAERG